MARSDENSVDGKGYRVKSLYFDNYNDKALMEKINGVNGREKFRLRLYNNDTSLIRLEKKSKKNGNSYKESTTISEGSAGGYLMVILPCLKKGNDLCMELYTKMRFQQLRPKISWIIGVKLMFTRQGNVRITLDHDIRTSQNIHGF